MNMKKIKFTCLLTFLIFPLFLNAGLINEYSAEQVAKNFYSEQTNISINDIQFETVIIKNIDNETYYFIFNIENNKGFVIVSAEDTYYPIIGYASEGKFVTENQPLNVKSWMSNYVKQIDYLRNNSVKSNMKIISLWEKYMVPGENFIKSDKNGKSVEPLAGDILWGQGSGWNDMCPEDDNGQAVVGCVATAMGIIMKFWNYPIHGTGSHTYYSATYGNLYANFGEATYFWDNMDNVEPNLFAAHILFHLGVSVNMSYSPDGSGAYSHKVDDALEGYFQYSTDALYVTRDGNYTQTEWINMLKGQIDAGMPVYYSGQSPEVGHAFVCSGYDDSDLFHFNWGWDGYQNGYFTVNDVNGFNSSQGAVINIHPENSNTYPNSPNSITAELDTDILNDFVVDIEWSAPSTKDVASYKLYRDLEEIADVSASTLIYTDDGAQAGNYYYSVSALHTNGDESLTVVDNVIGAFNINFVVHDADGNILTSNGINCQVTFNGDTNPTGFGSVSFNNVPFGGNKTWIGSADGHPTTSGKVDVVEDASYNIYLDGTQVNVETLNSSDLNLFPNPVNNILYVNISDINNEYTFEMINISGNTVKSGNIKSELMNINIENLSSGYYILKINTGNKILTRSFIKQ